jgi:hypothetical protein
MDPRFIESGATRYTSPLVGELAKTLKGGKSATAAAAGGKLFYLRVCNTTAAIVSALLFDGDNTDGLLCAPIPIPANGQVELKLITPMAFVNGLTINASTSQVANAAAGANALQIEALFK